MPTNLIRQLLIATVLLTLSASLYAVSLRPDAPKRYEVQRGDSLWGIAAMYIDDPWMWPQLWQANPDVENPHLIYPGDIIYLLDFEGLSMRDGRVVVPDGRSALRLEPRLRIITQQSPLPFLPLEQIEGLLNKDLMLTQQEFDHALYIVSLAEGRTLASRGDRVQALGSIEPNARYYGIYRNLEEVRDPITRRILGHRAESIGVARIVTAEAGQPANLDLVETSQEIRVGDRLIPFQPSPFDNVFRPAAPGSNVSGLLIRALSGDRTEIDHLQPVLLNLGSHEVQPGHLLEVMTPTRRLRNPGTGEVIHADGDVKGIIMVYRTFDKTSMAIVLQLRQTLQPGDLVRTARSQR